MKRFVCLLLAFFTLFALCSCTSEREKYQYQSSSQSTSDIKPEQNAKLVIWAAEDQKNWLNKVIDKFKSQYSQYGVDATIQTVDDYTVVSKIKDDGPNNVGPDVFMSAHDSLGYLVSAGLIKENVLTADTIKKDCVSAAYNASCYNGKLYGYPMSLTTYVLMYNKKLVSKPATTFSDIIKFAKTFNDAAQNKCALVFPVTETFYVSSFIQGYGGYILGKAQNDIGLNKKNAIQGLKFYQSLKQASPLNSSDETIGTCEKLFNQGKAAYEIAQIWAIQSAQDEKVDVGFAALPKMDNGKSPLPCATVSEMLVSAYAKYPNAAQLFAKIATSDEMMEQKMEMQNLVPVSISLQESKYFKGNAMLSALGASAKDAIATPNSAEMNNVWDPYLRAVTTIWNDKNANIQSTMDTCVNTIEQDNATQR